MDDLISRQAAIDAMGEEPPVWYDGEDEIAERNQWRRDVTAIKEMPSARPEPKTGEWIYAKAQLEIVPMWECSCCRIRMPKKFNYCPNCGARMKGGDTE